MARESRESWRKEGVIKGNVVIIEKREWGEEWWEKGLKVW